MSTARSAADTWVVAASLLIVALCWWWIVAMAGDIRAPPAVAHHGAGHHRTRQWSAVSGRRLPTPPVQGHLPGVVPRVPSAYPSPAAPGGGNDGRWRSGGRPSPGEDTDREQNVAKDREPEHLAGRRGGKGWSGGEPSRHRRQHGCGRRRPATMLPGGCNPQHAAPAIGRVEGLENGRARGREIRSGGSVGAGRGPGERGSLARRAGPRPHDQHPPALGNPSCLVGSAGMGAASRPGSAGGRALSVMRP
jgi:hypothetical protein